MHQMIHTILRFPLLIILSVSSLCLVIGLLLSSWAESRRERALRKRIEWSRQRQRLGGQPLPASNHTAGAGPGTAGQELAPAASRLLWNRFVWPAVVCIAVVLILLEARKPDRVAHARTIPQTRVTASVSRETHAMEPGKFSSLARIWYTNTPEQEAQTLSNSKAAGFPRQNQLGHSNVQVVLSPPEERVADPDEPASINWSVARSIHPEVIPPPPDPRPLVR
jgi:hypothetical protein